MIDYAVHSYDIAGQPWTPVIPQPWDPNISIDPGIYATPQPWGGDPGIVATPPTWGGDPGIYIDPRPQPSRHEEPVEAEPPVDKLGQLTAGDHIKHGAKTMIVPGIIGGVVSGALVASAGPHHLKGAVFTGRAVNAAIGTVMTGAAAGLLVAASSPKDGDSLRARYAVAGGLLGAASGAMHAARGSVSLGAGVAIGTAATAAMGWFIGGALAKRVEGEHRDGQLMAPGRPGLNLSIPT